MESYQVTVKHPMGFLQVLGVNAQNCKKLAANALKLVLEIHMYNKGITALALSFFSKQ